MEGIPRQLGRTAAAVATLGVCALLLSSPADAATTCDKVASPTGSDANPGTLGAPFRSAQHLADSLSGGQTGCLRAGAYSGGLRIATADVAVTSYPGERATVSGKTYLTKTAIRVTISDLNLVSGAGSGEFVNGTDDVFDGVDVTSNNSENCFIIGSSDPAYGRASGLVIENSRIHNCGQLNPDTNMDHGIYVAHADNTVIRDNWIYDNADRGVQLYPDSHGTHVYGNVIHGNGEGIVISGDGSTASSDSVVENNVISGSKIRWNVESNWPGGVVGTGNIVRNNCLYSSNSDSYYDQNGGILPRSEGGAGFSTSGNLVADPHFADVSAGNFQMPSDNPCASLQLGQAPPSSGVPTTGTGDRNSTAPTGNLGGSGEAGQGPHGAGAGRERVLLRVAQPTNAVGAAVDLFGQTAAAGANVTIFARRGGRWAKVAQTSTASDGSFTLHQRIAAGPGRLLLRAKVAGVGLSRPVAVRVHG
jgi:hypothetical protein